MQSCYSERQDIRIDPVSQPTTWVYDIVTPPIIGERMYYVLIDGELDEDAGLEAQTQMFPLDVNRPDSSYSSTWVIKLPKGKFSLVYNRDDSGPETFIYHPFKTREGWLRIQISPGQWPSKDSTRNHPESLPDSHKLKYKHNLP
ncbi:hypothetical protein [Spirosoma sp. KNUC1025]|uniref:hypothetical protein n=1 Tax=Spirosoma sp. KNUC1025 TaxID=2894082 RepID=UPI003870DD28|nr:hypothetical protein LN737_25355 [Spirosoma sp. KNUC1025]